MNACRSTPFLFITINNVTESSAEHMFGSLKPILLATSEGSECVLHQAVSCYEIAIISVMNATARLG